MPNFVTLTNDGYLDYTLNCLESLKRVGFKQSLHCYCLGEEAYNTLKKKGHRVTSLPIETEEDVNFQRFNRDYWYGIVKRKFDIIYSELKSGKPVFYVDSDIVFLHKHFMLFCVNNIGRSDILMANDGQSESIRGNLCTGFMLIKSNPATLSLFDPETVKKEVKPGFNDQGYINKSKHGLDYKALPLHLYPNGRFFQENQANYAKAIQPFMVHFNWLIGHKKKEIMKKFGHWYI